MKFQSANIDKFLLRDQSYSVRYFSIARHALSLLLKVNNIGKNDRVLLPEFICRDLLSSIISIGAVPVWYEVGKDLQPVKSPHNWPIASAVIAVNYFGFPQKLDPFKKYALTNNSLLIEDNAHGFLSKDNSNILLGNRADAGIFSLRKSLLIPDGAALVIKNKEISKKLPPQLEPKGRGIFPQNRIKLIFKKFLILNIIFRSFIRVIKKINILKYLEEQKNNLSSDIEENINFRPEIHKKFFSNIEKFNFQKEISRRRNLYYEIETIAKKLNIEPLFDSLPSKTVPYGFPFRAINKEILFKMKKLSFNRGLDLIHWPDLPIEKRKEINDYHQNVYMVNFL